MILPRWLFAGTLAGAEVALFLGLQGGHRAFLREWEHPFRPAATCETMCLFLLWLWSACSSLWVGMVALIPGSQRRFWAGMWLLAGFSGARIQSLVVSTMGPNKIRPKRCALVCLEQLLPCCPHPPPIEASSLIAGSGAAFSPGLDRSLVQAQVE